MAGVVSSSSSLYHIALWFICIIHRQPGIIYDILSSVVVIDFLISIFYFLLDFFSKSNNSYIIDKKRCRSKIVKNITLHLLKSDMWCT